MSAPEFLRDKKGGQWRFGGLTSDGKLSYKHPTKNVSVIVTPQEAESDDWDHSLRPRPKTKTVRQGTYECGPAALAMMLGEPLRKVKRAMRGHGWKNTAEGCTDEQLIAAARDLDYDLMTARVKDLEAGVRCLLTVPSLNYKDKWHALAWDGEEMLDPNVGREGRRWYGPEWSPETLRSNGRILILVGKGLSEEERKEIDEYHAAIERAEKEKLVAIAEEVIELLREAR